ncbi:MAG: dihydropteroate synthase [Acidobacteria bacterium]|nr:dihydropteroate synthase [Acidobacteriota bacterium]
MAILNVTPDSFADGGRYADPETAIAQAARAIESGAGLIDIGGESTRPGAQPVAVDEEWARVGPVIEGVRRRADIPISVDTYKAEVARRAIDCGADIVNDISALTYDPELAGVVARTGVALILMHTRGRSSDMYAHARYADVAAEVTAELQARDAAAREAGIAADRLLVDPGLGFAKQAPHSLAALAGLPRLSSLGRPIVSGPSRKSFLTHALGPRKPDERVWGTAAAVAASVLLGAHVVRVHDVAEMVEVVRVADDLRAAAEGQAG